MPQTDEAIRAYLLGLLPEGDAEKVEESYLADSEAFDRVRAIEDDLLDDYAAGRLGPAEKGAFETRYLASEPLRQRVVAARALRLASPIPARRPVRRWMPFALAAAFLVAVMGSAMYVNWRDRGFVPPGSQPTLARTTPDTTPTPSPGPSTTPTSGTPSPGSTPKLPATSRLVFALSPTLLRGESGPPLVRVPPGTATVVLELQGDPAAIPPHARLSVEIETVEGERVWSGAAERASRSSAVASAAVPAARLGPADYLVTLSAGGQVLHRYYFRVPAR